MKRLVEKYKKWRLNRYLHKYFSEIESELNKNSLPKPKKQILGDVYHYPTMIGFEAGTTRVPKKEGAFNLNPPISGKIIDKVFTENPQEGIILRSVIGHYTMSRLLDNPKEVKNILSILVKSMILSLEKELGFSPDNLNYGKYGFFKLPGKNQVYFREMENFAGYELRLYSDCYNIEQYDKEA